jgi:hypothetical protein
MSTIELFKVTTVVREFDGFKDVVFCWFYNGDRLFNDPERPFAELIKDYDPDDPSFYEAQEHIYELFSEAEAQQLKVYLDAHYDEAGTTIIELTELPIPATLGPTGAALGFFGKCSGAENGAGAGVRQLRRV